MFFNVDKSGSVWIFLWLVLKSEKISDCFIIKADVIQGVKMMTKLIVKMFSDFPVLSKN